MSKSISAMRNKNKIPENHNKANLRILAGNLSTNPLAEVDNKYQKYINEDITVNINCVPSKELTDDQLEWMVNLTEVGMKDFYDKSETGWNSKSKEKEFKHETARILFIRNSTDNKLVGFVHFRFELDDEQKFPVVYCYEIQLESNFQGKGLGKFLMNVLVEIGSRFKCNKVMLTCFKHNLQATKFYEKLGYGQDVCSPSKCGLDRSYEILCLKTKHIAKK